MRVTKHEPTELCASVHCRIHQIDEPGEGAYKACFECGHVYQRPRHLRRAYRRAWNEIVLKGWPTASWRRSHPLDDTHPELLWFWLRSRFIRAREITFCQECAHDF